MLLNFETVLWLMAKKEASYMVPPKVKKKSQEIRLLLLL